MNVPRVWLPLVATMLFSAFGHSGSAQESDPASGMQHGQHGMMSADMSRECQDVMSQRQRMMTQMKDNREELSALADEMHDAKGDAKIAAIEDVVSALVQQRHQMMEHMNKMQPMMMAHMMRHMQMNMQEGGTEDPASGCPMMKEMMSMSEGESEP